MLPWAPGFPASSRPSLHSHMQCLSRKAGGSELPLRPAPWLGAADSDWTPPWVTWAQVSVGGSDPVKGPSPGDMGRFKALEGAFWSAARLPHLYPLTLATPLCGRFCCYPYLTEQQTGAQIGEAPRPRAQLEWWQPGCAQEAHVHSAPWRLRLLLGPGPLWLGSVSVRPWGRHRKPPSPQTEATSPSINFSSDQDAFGLHLRASHLPLSWLQS